MNDFEKSVEMLSDGEFTKIERFKVDGGYIYRSCSVVRDVWLTDSMVFVPDVDLQRYQAHLRDAYSKGYQDGHADARNGTVEEPDQNG